MSIPTNYIAPIPDVTSPPIPPQWQDAITTFAQVKTLLATRAGYAKTWLDKFITVDPALCALKDTISLLSTINETVLLVGPSGHGKELLARALHWRPELPFIAVNCAALSDTLLTSLLFGHKAGSFTGATEDRPGAFEAAGGGTVFLDEIGDMPMSQQPALLRVLQEREVMRVGDYTPHPINCRIIAATNQNPATALRPDLYGRLMALEFRIPPLSTRPDDVIQIAASLGLEGIIHLPAESLDAQGVRYIQAVAKRRKYGIATP